MTKVTVSETTYSVSVAEETVNVTVADAQETIQVQIASGASDTQIISVGEGNSLISSTAGVVTSMKTISAGNNITLSDDGDTITVSSIDTEDDLSNNTTDELAEGSNNLYYTDARVQDKLADVTGHIIPDTDSAYDLGAPDKKWRSLYLSGGSLYVEGQKIIDSTDGTINVTTDAGEDLHISSGRNVVIQTQENAVNQQFNVEVQDINLGPINSTGTVNIRGTVEAPDLHVGSLEIDSTQIVQTQPNQNLTLKSNGTGFVYVETSDFYVGDVLTSAVKIDENSISGFNTTVNYIGNLTGSVTGTVSDISNHTTTDLTEGTNLYYTDARVDTLLGTKGYATQTYVDTSISNLVDSAPATLDTLNELAAALGDDANFSTTVTNSIATKWTQDNTKIANWDTAYSWGDHSVEGYLTSYTETDPVFTGHVASSILSTDITNWNTAYGWGNHATQGYITDYTVTEADVTQHQAALSITESQISDLTHYTDSDARTAISLNSTNTNELSYDNTTGVFSYTSPSTVAATGQVVFDVRNASCVDISRGDAVYISGHSGGKILVALADANDNAKNPAIGLANTAMNNNSDGTVLVGGEMTSIDTSAFSVGDVLYLSETAGQLTNTKPTAETSKVQNMGKVARSDNQNGIIIVVGSGRANDVPNLASGHVFIGNSGSYETRALDTDDVSEGSNLYYTDARARAAISATGSLSYDSNTGVVSFTETPQDFAYSSLTGAPTNVSHFTNDAGYITGYTVTQSDVTQHQAALSITESQITDLSHFTSANAITAVQNEATLDLTGQVTMSQDLDVSGLIKINDGFTLGSFNPYAGFGGTAMPTTIMGAGQEDGWAALTVRSRGEHDWGLSGFGIPPEAPRALNVLQAGRLDGSSDDYLNSGDLFAQIMMNPYSGYRTGTEWLTPSAVIEAEATENHSSSGMGTKLTIRTTTNGSFGGATDSAHTDGEITIQGTTVSTNGTLNIDDSAKITGTLAVDDAVTVTGSVSTKNSVIGDFQYGGNYDFTGMRVNAGDTAWAGIIFSEYEGGADKPLNAFTNAGFQTEIYGGTPTNQQPLNSGKRLIAINGTAANSTSGIPATSNLRILGTTTETQSSTNRGAQWEFHTIPTGESNTQTTMFLRDGNTLQLGNDTYENGDGYIGAAGGNLKIQSPLDTNGNDIVNTNGDVKVNDNLQVTGTLQVDGNVTLGDSNQDTITVTGKLKPQNGLKLTVLDTATANYLAGVLGVVETGDVGYISDGDGGNPCIAVYNGSSWKRISFGSDISST